MATQEQITPRPANQSNPLQVLASRLVGHAAVYASGTVLSMAFAVFNLAVLTRLLVPSAFGALAILMLYSGLLTMLCNLGIVQGTMASAYSGGQPGELAGDGDGDDDDMGGVETRPASDNRRRLTTGFVIAIGVSVTITLLSVPAAPSLSRMLTGTSGYAAAVVWATAAGGLGSLWRIISGLPRLERRPRTYVGLQLGRSVLILGVGALFIEMGYGLTGAIAGLVVGKIIALLVGFQLSRRRFRWAFSLDDAAAIMRNGRPLILLTVSLFLARNADIFVLSRYATNADVAIYRVAERLGQMPAFGVSAALTAWGPLLRGPLRVALENQKAIDVARSRLVTYYIFLAVTVVVAVALWADVLIRVAPPSYASADDLLILMAIAAGLHGGLTVAYRMTRFKKKLPWYRRTAVVMFLITLGFALWLIPDHGAYGAAYAALAAPLPGVVFFIWRSQRGDEPLQLDARRLLGCVALGAAWIGLALVVRSLVPEHLHAWVDVAFSIGWPVLLIGARILPPAEVRRLLALLMAPWRGNVERRRLRSRLSTLGAEDRALLDALARHRERPADVAARYGIDDDALMARFVRLLRELDGLGAPSELDSEIGRYLLSSDATPTRDRMGHMLSLRQDALPLELDRLTVVFQSVRAAR